MKELNKLNNELKSYINEANFISNKCRNKLIAILGKEFNIDVKLENYANVDVKILEDGSLEIRGDKYKNNQKYTLEEINEHFENFKIQADKLLKKKEVNYNNKNDLSNILNLFVILGILVVFLFLIYICVSSFLVGDFYNVLWLIVFIFPYFVPNLRENLIRRLETAKNFLKRKFKR